MKKLLCVSLFVVLLSIVFAVPTLAQPVNSSAISPFEIDIFASRVNNDTIAIDPQTVEVLYDLSGNPSFLIADIMPYGFAIMFRHATEISEQTTSEGAINPFATARGRRIYAGPMTYIDFYGGVYVNLLSGEPLNNEIIEHLRRATETALANLPEPLLFQPLSIPIERRITNSRIIETAGFGRNTTNTCGQIAASIILVYYAMSNASQDLMIGWGSAFFLTRLEGDIWYVVPSPNDWTFDNRSISHCKTRYSLGFTIRLWV